MKKTLLISILTIFLFANGYAQGPLWKQTTTEQLTKFPKTDRASRPMQFKVFSLDLATLKTQLQTAPSRFSARQSEVVLPFPDSEGKLQHYRIYEASVMDPELAARHPEIQSYVGENTQDPTNTIRISTTIFGLHVMSFSNKGVSFIDPFTTDLQNYIVYDKSQLTTTKQYHCDVTESLTPEETGRLLSLRLATDGQFRTYRLAMGCTAQYAAYHIAAAGVGAGTTAQKKAAVLAAMNVSMVRINGVYEKEMSLRMVLVPNEENVIFVDAATQPYTGNDDATTLINESQTVIDANIGSANYDIGHTVSTGGGGLAQSPSVCMAGSKARGITGSPDPVGDAYDIDFVAHEMGHQFSASHTFNGTTAAADGNCTGGANGTRAAAYAVEPGSGTTIMAYAGICGIQDVQAHSDDYFHAVSLAQMMTYVSGTGNCSVNVANGNTAPVANAGVDYIIPKGTAYVLTGTGSDANGDTLTYCWEQTDNQTTLVTQPPTATNAGGPNYRSVTPTTSPKRYLPALASVVAGNLIPKWEVTPNVGRTLHFALTTRDNRTPNGGQTGRDDMTVTTVAAAGPFAVTSQNSDQLVLVPGSTQTVTWNVAGTTANGINTANVNILFSSDNGVTFPTVLASNTPNDGTESITIPNISAANCRIMVQSVGNIFYAVNGRNIAVGNYTYSAQNVCQDYEFQAGIAIPESATSYSGYGLTINDTYTLTDINIHPVFTHPNIGNVYFAFRHPSQTVGVTRLKSGSCTGSANLDLIFDDQGTAINCANTTSGATTLPLDPMSVFNGLSSAGSWVFYMVDTAVGDGITGTWDSVTFNLCHSELVPTLAVENFGLEGFSIYPNPNSGNFNVKFNSYSSNEIKISVHD
ncbi:MAG TPA: zinc-dependent metalloprotease family protein, partial [Flavobacterium sp.]|nr:zinc-dependent metalloprotease family protein [Flavobacterium sp.]